MGLDVVLGVIVLLAALRGWFRGFTSQAVGIASFIVCFYLAGPVREEIRPYVIPNLPLVAPWLLDCIFWWVSAVIAYIVTRAVLSLAVRLMRTPPEPGEPMPWREDRIGGMFLGVGKGLIVAALLSALVLKFDEDLARHASWAQRQTKGSFALKWSQQYRPVPRIWAAPPVRHFVEHIQRNGMGQKTETEPAKEVAERTPVDAQASGVSPRLDLPAAEGPAD